MSQWRKDKRQQGDGGCCTDGLGVMLIQRVALLSVVDLGREKCSRWAIVSPSLFSIHFHFIRAAGGSRTRIRRRSTITCGFRPALLSVCEASLSIWVAFLSHIR